MVITTNEALENGLREIFHRAYHIDVRKIPQKKEYWATIKFKLGQLSSSIDYLDFQKVDELAKKFSLARHHFYQHADMEIVRGSGTTVDGYSQLTFSFEYWHYDEE